MKYITGNNRNQMQFFSLEEYIHQDNEVRLIDLFVNSLDLQQFGFELNFSHTGRPPYHPKDLLKLYLYGYLNRIRSSRQLEKECQRNIEVMWLMKGLVPDHNTISNFRKDNPKAIQKVFHATIKVAKDFELIGGKLLAGDGTRVRAQNSKKNNFNLAKIERHINYIDQKLEEYNNLLASEDGDTISKEEKEQLSRRIKKHKKHKEKYRKFEKELKETGEKQISTSDPESRQIMVRNNIAEVCYNIQATVDAKNYIPIDYKVTNTNDSKAMGNMLRRAKTIYGHSNFTALYDKGYHTGSEIAYADFLDIETLVAIPAVASHAPDHDYDIEHFIYNQENDYYICPQGQKLKTNGRWYSKSRTASTIKVKHYKTKKCITCPVFELCTKNKKGRLIERSQFQKSIDDNAKRIGQNKELYKKRQAIVEHPFGIIKRQWGFDYIMTKQTMKRASADVGLIFCAYNLRRIFNLIDKNKLQSYWKALCLFFYLKMNLFKRILRLFFTTIEKPQNKFPIFKHF